MVRPDPPYMLAGLYWGSEPQQVSFRRVCHWLMQQGMTTLGWGAFAAPDEALLRLLEQPESDIQEAHFITASQKRPAVPKSRRPPGKLIISYGFLSDAAVHQGAQRAIQLAWSGSSFSGPPGYVAKDAEVKGLQAYRFFTQLCAQLDPLYAAMEMENRGDVPCLYDVLHPQQSPSKLSLSEFYCRQGVLGEQEEAFWHTYAYSERLPYGTYGSDYPFFNPRRRRLTGDRQHITHIETERRSLLMQALKRFSQSMQPGLSQEISEDAP